MSPRRKSPSPIRILPRDIVSNGQLILWRNVADQPFNETDNWELSASWQSVSDIPAAYEQLQQQVGTIAQKHSFAWNADFGYLSPNPHHCGIAMSAAGRFHLEGLGLIGDIDLVLNGLNAIRFEHTNLGKCEERDIARTFDIYSNVVLGISESDLVQLSTRVFNDLITQEINARRALIEENPRILEDAISRSLAILRCARMLCPSEFLDLLSPISIGVAFGFLDGITRKDIQKFNDTYLELLDDDLHKPVAIEIRDSRDAHLADIMNKRFQRVVFNSTAETYFG